MRRCARSPAARSAMTAFSLLACTAVGADTKHDGADDAHAGAGAEHGHESHHTLGLFLGNSTEDRREDPRRGGTIGIEYEYRFAPNYGFAVVLEHIAGEVDVNVLAAGFAYHDGPWKFYGGPGIERGHGETEPMVRIGAEYDFHFGKLEVSPQVDLDFVSGERVFVVGVVFAVPL